MNRADIWIIFAAATISRPMQTIQDAIVAANRLLEEYDKKFPVKENKNERTGSNKSEHPVETKL